MSLEKTKIPETTNKFAFPLIVTTKPDDAHGVMTGPAMGLVEMTETSNRTSNPKRQTANFQPKLHLRHHLKGLLF